MARTGRPGLNAARDRSHHKVKLAGCRLDGGGDDTDTPRDCFRPARLRRNLHRICSHVVGWQGDESMGPTIDPAAIATSTLLHEKGHIHNATGRQFDPAPAVRGSDCSDTDPKRRELSADAFAARVQPRPTPPFIASMKVCQSLTQLGWNLLRDQPIRQYGAAPSTFGDVGGPHPNLEPRGLITQVLIDDPGEARSPLDEFVATRARAATEARP